ncbi:hypothetical protein BH20ACI4_BH20ACI4_11000 [soil metagenome]
MKKYLIALFLLFVAAAISVSAQSKEADRVKIEADQNYLILSTKRIQTMEKELDEVAAKGFRVLYGAPTVTYDMALFLEKLENPERPFSYKILATSRNKTMEKELNEQAAKGFRLLPRTMIFKQGLFTAEVISVMERGFESNDIYEYKLVEAGKEIKLQKKIDAARADGFNPVTMITLGEHVVVMEKITGNK